MPASKEDYPFFTYTDCPHFPCHKGIDPADFNCLFCFCPLYMLGPACGGNFRYNAKGNKVCTDCSLPHHRNRGNELVREKWPLIRAKAAQGAEGAAAAPLCAEGEGESGRVESGRGEGHGEEGGADGSQG